MEDHSLKIEMDQTNDVNNQASLPAASDSDVVAPVENVTIGPARTKPVMKVDPTELGSGNLFSRLSSFLPQMKAANDELEQDRMMGRLGRLKMEISSDEEESDSEDDSSEDDEESSDDGSSDSESSQKDGSDNMDGISSTDSTDKGKKRKHKKVKAPYIEMNLGLGVLEERRPRKRDSGQMDSPSDIIHRDDDSSSSSSEDNSDTSSEADEEEERDRKDEKPTSAVAMKKLMNVDGTRSTELAPQYKKPRIEEL